MEEIGIERSVLYWRTFHKAQDMLEAALLSGRHLNPFVDVWKHFRDAIIADDRITDFWKDERFTWGFWILMKTVDDMIELYYMEGTDQEKAKIANKISERLIGECKSGFDSDHISILKLIEAFKIISARHKYHGFSMEDIKELEMDLATIANSQRMVLDVVKSEKKLETQNV